MFPDYCWGWKSCKVIGFLMFFYGWWFSAKTIKCNDEFEFQDGLASLQSSDSISEHILRQIEVLKSQVNKLKARVDKVVSENPVKFSSVNALIVLTPADALTSSDCNLASVVKMGDSMPSKFPRNASKMGDLMPENAVSSHGEARSDMIGSTGLPHVEASCGNVRVSSKIYNLPHFTHRCLKLHF